MGGGEVTVEVARTLSMGASNQAENTNMTENSAAGIAVLICAVISLLGFLSILPWNSIRRSHERRRAETVANTGLKKECIKALPYLIYTKVGTLLNVSECPICLGDFIEGEKVRVLPKCKHSFHKGCVDKWLVSHSSCPSCRHCLVQTTERGTERGEEKEEDGETHGMEANMYCTGFDIECIVNP